MKKTTVKTQVKDLKKGEKIEHYNTVLLEDIKSKMEWVIKGMDFTKTDLKNAMGHLDQKITQEIELLKTVIHSHSDELNMLRHAFSGLNDNIKENNLQTAANNKNIDNTRSELKHEMHQMEKRLSDKIDKIGERVEFHETRPTTVEEKLNIPSTNI